MQPAELLDEKGSCANYVNDQIQQLTFSNALSALQKLQLVDLDKEVDYIIEPPNKKNLMKYPKAANITALFHESPPNARIETA